MENLKKTTTIDKQCSLIYPCLGCRKSSDPPHEHDVEIFLPNTPRFHEFIDNKMISSPLVNALLLNHHLRENGFEDDVASLEVHICEYGIYVFSQSLVPFPPHPNPHQKESLQSLITQLTNHHVILDPILTKVYWSPQRQRVMLKLIFGSLKDRFEVINTKTPAIARYQLIYDDRDTLMSVSEAVTNTVDNNIQLLNRYLPNNSY